MDINEECVADTGSACKRQRRNNSDNEDGSEAAATTIAAAASISPAAAASKVGPKQAGRAENRKEANKTVNSHNNNNNSNNSSKLDCQKKQQTDEPMGMETVDATTNVIVASFVEEAAATTSTADKADRPDTHAFGSLKMRPASFNHIPRRDNLRSSVISDDDSVEPPDIQPVSPTSTGSIHSVYSVFSSSSSSSSGSDLDIETHSDANTSDTHVDGNDDGDEEEATEAADTDNSDNESPESPDVLELPDDSSSDNSVAFWNRYYTSSNEDADSDDDYNEVEENPADKQQIENAVNKVLCKTRPSYNWNFTQELMHRESNLINRIEWRGGHTSEHSFNQGFYGSMQVVERMKLLSYMPSHRGCVNCLNFNRSGDLICSGSDDLSIIVWDWASGTPRHTFKSGHSLNIFQTKFIDSTGCLDIVSSSRDGQVRRAVIPPSGSSSIKPMRLYAHSDAVHKLVVVPQNRHEIMSAGEDASVKHFDLRSNTSTTMLRCVSSEDMRRVRLFSIAHHPFAPEFCVSGSDDKLRVYDKRNLTKEVHSITPHDLAETKVTQITCAVYNHSGSEILASFSDAGIYLFDTRNYQKGAFLHSYEGHINSRTIKGVNFFGPHSEYIVSGSDCGNIFFWDKNTEAVINFMKGDNSGVVNCLEPHPWMPVLATSGLEYNVKLWTPSGPIEHNIPCSIGLKDALQRNFRRSILDVGDFDISQIHYFIRQLIEPRRNARRAAGQDIPELYSSSSSTSSTASLPSSTNSSPGRANADAAASPQGQQGSSSDEGNNDPLGCRQQ